ncbi:MAG: molybdopterin biosynthesis protein, partial [Chloroflexota bacterium]
MSVYLHDIPLPEAQARLQIAIADAGLNGILGEELIQLDEGALGRVLSRPIWAKISSPHYHAAAMDGFAIMAKSTHGASMSAPLTLEMGLDAQYVDTG